MCTVVLRHKPGEPLLLLGVRDEFERRSWQPPAAHWAGLPLIGGLDERAGGTWLAVYPELRRVACVLNGRGTPAPADYRSSRGELPLKTALDGRAHKLEIADYDPFHLIYADLSQVWALSWDGKHAKTFELTPGTHLFTNAGHVYPDPEPDEKGAFFGPRFEAAEPDGWKKLAEGEGLAPDDPRAIIVRHELPDGRVWGSSSVTFVELTADRVQYGFRIPGQPWRAVA
jgi:hypothetical protein